MVHTDFPLSDVPVGNHGSWMYSSSHRLHNNVLVNKTTMIPCRQHASDTEEVGISKSINWIWKKLKRKGVALWKDKNRGSVDFYEDDDMGEKTKKHPFFTKKSTDI